jgi:hypothetical protein
MMPDRRSGYCGASHEPGVATRLFQGVQQTLRVVLASRWSPGERPIIGDRGPPSPLRDIQRDAWAAEYTTELLNLLEVLGLLVDLEPAAAALLERTCAGLFTDAPVGPSERKRKARRTPPPAPDPRSLQFDGF